MARSAIQAVQNPEHTYGIPVSKIAVTPMIVWSLDRDTFCSDTCTSPTCDSVSSTTPRQYTEQFLSDLGD